ncbi:hypothetical protein D8S78_23550 [Natrialba swarupiae]|nr:hypothetical protein [Natrialba swarupiae]
MPGQPSYEGEILGTEVHPSVSSIPDRVDLVYVVTPAGAVPTVLEDAGEADVAGAVIFSAGFSEVGNEDRRGTHPDRQRTRHSLPRAERHGDGKRAE